MFSSQMRIVVEKYKIVSNSINFNMKNLNVQDAFAFSSHQIAEFLK